MDIKDIKDLIITMDKTSIEKVEIEQKDLKIMISKKVTNDGNILKTSANYLEDNDISTKKIDYSIEEIKNETSEEGYSKNLIDDENTLIVKSPIVGTFYEASSPDNPPFVKIGDLVKKGQTLCIIEAMKIMNEIQSEFPGEIIEIFVKDEDIVEYGQPLMRIRR